VSAAGSDDLSRFNLARGFGLAPPAGGDRLPSDVRAWGLVSFCSDLGHETVTSLLPAFLAGLGAPPASLGLIEGVSDGAATFTKLLGGRLADRLRRLKPPAIAGYVLTGLAMPAISIAGGWGSVLVLRTLAWLGRGVRAPLRDTLLDRAVAPHQRGRAFGLERAMDQVGAVVAPLTASLLLHFAFGIRTIMALAVVPGVTAALIVALAVRERARPGQHGAAQADAPSGAGHRPLPGSFKRMLVALGVFGSGDFAKTLLVLWALGPAAGRLNPGAISVAVLLYAGFNLMTVLAAWLGGRASDTVGRKPVLVTAYAVGCLSSMVPVLARPSLASAALALGLAGLLVGTEEAVERAWAADLTPQGRRGWAFGLVHMTNGIGDFVASVAVGALWTAFGARIAFATAAALMVLGTLMTAAVPVPRRTD
jgi:MFS family permease